MFTREDWTLFRTLQTLAQKAGVATRAVPALVAKELADNALDASGGCRVGLLPDNGFFVEDDGDGIPGDDDAVAALFSINRPLASTKLLRLPTRGALGNGLRVVAGAVLAWPGCQTTSWWGSWPRPAGWNRGLRGIRWPPSRSSAAGPRLAAPGASSLLTSWQLSQPEPGVLIWHTPSGRSYTTTPTKYPA